jgi:hypothetical protein
MSLMSMHQTQHLLITEPAWLTAFGGRLWVTRDGDLNDYVLEPGQRVAVGRGDQVTVGAWSPGEPTRWTWTPATEPPRYGFLRTGVALAFGAAARALRGAADGFAALARTAASIARRAQGCISCGDSIASAGTVQ